MEPGSLRRVRSSVIFALDLVAITGIFAAVYFLRLQRWPDPLSLDLWIIVATLIVALFLSGTYFRERSTQLPSLPIRTFLVCLIGGAVCLVWLYLRGPEHFTEYYGRGILISGTIASGIATTLNRFAINRLYHLQESGADVLYLGYSENCKALLRELENHSEVRSVTIAADVKEAISSSRVHFSNKSIGDLVAQKNWKIIVIDPDWDTSEGSQDYLITKRLQGTPILSLADFYEKYWFMVPIRNISDEWFLRSQGFYMLDNPIAQRIKRSLDIALSVIVLVVTSPVLIVAALLIKITSPGPILYSQTRVGRQGALFTIYKLRTMRIDAERAGPQWTAPDDPRITPFGNFLRKSRIDELPQCWNVLTGAMSFVGPRPERPEFTGKLAEQIRYYDLRHLVKPGITGWAQVIFPYGSSVDDALRKLQYELFYIKHQSLLLDLNILLRTMITVFQRSGR